MESANQEISDLKHVKKRLTHEMKTVKANNTILKSKNKKLKTQNLNYRKINNNLERENKRLKRLMHTVCEEVCTRVQRVSDKLTDVLNHRWRRTRTTTGISNTSARASFHAFNIPSLNNTNLNNFLDAESRDGDSVMNYGSCSDLEEDDESFSERIFKLLESDNDMSDAEEQDIDGDESQTSEDDCVFLQNMSENRHFKDTPPLIRALLQQNHQETSTVELLQEQDTENKPVAISS